MNLKAPAPGVGSDLLGIDVGFSKVQMSTGIACLHEDKLTLYRADSTWESRKRLLPQGFFPLMAIDGPLLPESADPKYVRECEQFFSRGLFCRRCKPGLSHFGTGFLLRQAALEAAHQFAGYFQGMDYRLGANLVEAFPNLFLGVMVREDQYKAMPKLARGRKFDWLYECAVEKACRLCEHVILPDVVYDAVRTETDHELRASLICLLTAATACEGAAVRAGTPEGGWFWLPPMALWEPWAVEAARANLQ